MTSASITKKPNTCCTIIRYFTTLVITICCLTITGTFQVLGQTDSLQRKFLFPTLSAKPSVWWFWGESITTDHGITKDLEALKRVGFGGVVIYEQVFKDAPDALKSLSPEWMTKVRFAASECARLGLRLEVNTSSGYVAGGPWITPALGMQRLVSSETQIAGGNKVSVKLAQPPTKLEFYRDVAILAFPTLNDQQLPAPKISSLPQLNDLEKLFEVGTKTKVRISPSPDHVMVCLDYGKPVTARSITYALRAGSKALIIATQVLGNWSKDFYGENMMAIPNIGELQASDDGIRWKTLRQLSGRGYQFEGWDKQTLSFPATTARFFRLNLHDWGHNERAKDDDLLIGSINLHGSARTDQWEKKSGNTVDFSDPDQTPEYRGNEVVTQSRMIDLTKLVSADGQLNWDAPAGKWTILRFGHTPTGIKTKHGRPETMGLECDKLSADAVRVQFDNYIGKILKEIRLVPGAKLDGVNMDSAEHGTQNWTADFPSEFFKRRGYRIEPYLPAMAGYVVNSRAETDRFLYDVRLTISDMMSDLYYGTFQKLCHQEGLSFMAQAPGIATCMPSDNIQAKGRTDIPMAEFWMSQENGTIDCKEASSAAHVYGANIVAAESFTGSMANVAPSDMKPLADVALAQGINRFVVLAYMHQPWDDRKPGVTENRFYLPYQRHNTWWEQSTGFWNTLARSSEMMQAGKKVNDILYYLGSDAPIKIATWRMRPVPPVGYDYDVCSDEILLRTRFQNGLIMLPDGMSYRLLILASGNHVSFAVANHLKQLIKKGAVILAGKKITGTPSLSDKAERALKVKAIGNLLWGSTKSIKPGLHYYGKGCLLTGKTPEEAMAYLNIAKDFEIISPNKVDILFNHRRSGDDEIYFLANHDTVAADFSAKFRVHDLYPQAWDPERGKIGDISGYKSDNTGIVVPIKIESHGSLIVVFRKKLTSRIMDLRLTQSKPVWKNLKGSWNVKFEEGRGAPKEEEFSKLISWTEMQNSGIQHFSGTAIYTKDINIEKLPGNKLVLDLGEVGVLASVKVNGTECGTIWKKPFAFEISGLLYPGKNKIEVSVTNLWVNRLIADSGLPANKQISWATFNPYNPTDKLLPSGLIGPVVIRQSDK